MLNKSSSRTELAFFDHQSTVIRPVNILLNSGQTILIGGIVRIDVKHVSLLYCFVFDCLIFVVYLDD